MLKDAVSAIPQWVWHVTGPLAAAVASYYAGQVTLEHRLTKLEEDTAGHYREDDRGTASVQKQFDNVWYAIKRNHGEAP